MKVMRAAVSTIILIASTSQAIAWTSLCILLTMASAYGQTVPRGTYMEVYYGAKSGGPANHGLLMTELSADRELLGFVFFCVKGLSRAADDNVPGFAIDRERRLPPVVVHPCKGSGAILLGPIQGENVKKLKDYLEANYMHLYSDLRKVD